MNRLHLTVLLSLLILFSALVFYASCSTDKENNPRSTWSEVQENGYGNITLYFVPSDGFSYRDDSDSLTGVTIELMRDFVDFLNDEYGVNVSIQFHAKEQFSEFYQTVKDGAPGELGVANVTITEERKNEIAFSPPYLTNIATLITHSNVDEIEDLDEIPEKFDGLTALAFEGTLHEERLNEMIDNYLPESTMEFAQSNNEIIERTSSENRYFAYVDIYNYWRAMQAGAELKRHSPADESSEQFGVIMPLESDWQGVMVEFFEKDNGYMNSAGYRELMERHLGDELAELLLSQ